MKINTKIFALAISLFLVAGSAGLVYAYAPVLSVIGTGNGDNVQLTVTGDSNSSVLLYYNKSGFGLQNSYIGTTNYNGYFSTTVSATTYGIVPNSSVYVIINNQTSSSIIWPYTSQATGSIYFSQTNPVISIGQSTAIYLSGGSGNNYYIFSNSNPIAIQATIISNTLNLYGNLSNGSATIMVCSSNNVCGSLTAAIGYGSGNINVGTSFLIFSQPNPTLSVNQSMTITISGGNYYGAYNGSTYYVPYNSDPSTIQTSISGNVLTITGRKNGSVIIVICDSTNNCGSVPIVVGNAYVPYHAYPIYPGQSYNNYPGYTFTRFLTYGSTGEDVRILQQILTDQGFYSGAIGGNYGYLTKAAVVRFQATNGLLQTGNIGTSTRDVLNNLAGSGLQE